MSRTELWLRREILVFTQPVGWQGQRGAAPLLSHWFGRNFLDSPQKKGGAECCWGWAVAWSIPRRQSPEEWWWEARSKPCWPAEQALLAPFLIGNTSQSPQCVFHMSCWPSPLQSSQAHLYFFKFLSLSSSWVILGWACHICETSKAHGCAEVPQKVLLTLGGFHGCCILSLAVDNGKWWLCFHQVWLELALDSSW